MNNNFSFGIIILAAGSSSRLGKPKQLLRLKGKTLLDHFVTIAAKTPAAHISVVINDQITPALFIANNAGFIVNKNNKTGMSSSISLGLKHLLQTAANIDAVIIMVCDQPLVNASVLNSLVDQHIKERKSIVASAYAGTYGTPALFHKSFFNELMLLTGDSGAKKIIAQNEDQLSTIEFPHGSIDIDTPEDWKKWMASVDT